MTNQADLSPPIDTVITATRHWVEQIVIGLNLCPFARAPYRKERLSAAQTEDELVADLAEELGFLAAADAESTETTLFALENCTNRLPYPTLHLLRESSIDRAIDSIDDTDDIYRRNIETLRKLGWSGLGEIRHRI